MHVRKILLAITILGCASVAWAQAICPLDGSAIKPKEVADLSSLKRMAVLEHGRVKPFDSYAQNILVQFSGRRTFQKQPASAWVARLLLAPEMTKDDAVFLINNPAIVEALGIEEEKKRRYSFAQLEEKYEQIQKLAIAANQIEAKERDVVEAELIRLNNNLQAYSALSLSFAFAYPNAAFTISVPENLAALELPENVNQFSFLDIAFRADKLQELTKPLERLPNSEWTTAQQEMITVITNLFQWSMLYRELPFTIIPSYIPNDKSWYSPWDASAIGLTSEAGRNELIFLRDAMAAYWNGRQLEFDLAVKNFSESVKKRVELTDKSGLKHLSLEVLYNKLNLFFLSKMICLLAFLLTLFGLGKTKSKLRLTAYGLVTLGCVLQGVALVMRIIILKRPPVSNLYETFIFVSFVSVLVGLFIERINKQGLGNIIASISGFIFLSIGSKFSAEGDTLQMLVAVLNSNFWLGTHVLSITIGYAGACVAGIIGHVYILQAVFKPKEKEKLASTERILIGALGFGLTMTFLGTNLGGIWADQSWGRFWGWDPKENGALLIIIWLAILFHAKIGRMIGPLGLAVGSALGIIVVMWAWFGVNLLSVGLHSYGFTSGLATNLTIYVLLQLLFVTIFYPLAKKKLK